MPRWAPLVVVLAQAACGTTDPSGDSATPSPSPSNLSSGCTETESNACQTAEQTAQEHFDTHAACRAGERCVLVNQPELGIPCSPRALFHCPFAVNSSTDVAAFATRAREIQAQAQVCSQCGVPCPMPRCIPSVGVVARCDTALGRCGIVPR